MAFTLNSTEDAEGLNCLCVHFHEVALLDFGYSGNLSELIAKRKFVKVQRAFCFMFKGDHYQTFLDLINMLLYAQKLDRVDVATKLMPGTIFNSELQLDTSLERDLQTMLKSKPVSNKMNQLLTSFSTAEAPLKSLDVSEVLPDFTVSKFDADASDYWFCPMMFSVLKCLDNLLTLLSAVFQEKQIICYGSNLNSVSSVILGLESLLRPFSWMMTFIPILPCILIDHLEAPMPYLAGIS